MNCHEFETVVCDLASHHLMMASVRLSALAHAEICKRCGDTLADEQSLSSALVKASASDIERAPERIKIALLNSFSEIRSTAPLIQTTEVTPRSRKIRRWGFGIAAAALIFAIAALVWMMPGRAVRQEIAGAGSESIKKTNEVVVNSEKDSSSVANDESNQSQTTSNPKSPVRRPVRRFARHSKSTVSDVAASESSNAEYIALNYMPEDASMDGATVIRTSVPRSSLIAMGLPMNVDMAGEKVKVDLYIGADGITRAIRLVQ
jgi:hypothetical protein